MSERIDGLQLLDFPDQTASLLLHLKKFAELLLAWGFNAQAIQICKVISRTVHLLERGKRSPKFDGSGLVQCLLYSELSLGQAASVNSYIEPQPNCPECCPGSALQLECQICNLTVRGLAY